MHLQAYEWVVSGLLLVLLVLPAFKSVGVAAAWSKLCSRFVKTPATEDKKENPVRLDSELHATYQAFLDVRAAVKEDQRAVEALDRLVLPTLVSGASDPRYSVTWEGKQ